MWWLLTACLHAAAPLEAGVGDQYVVDGVPVDEAGWRSAVAKLRGPQVSWTCSETTTGGEVTYYQRRGAGWVFVTEASDGGLTRNELHAVPESEVPEDPVPTPAE